jgi:ADYC domain
MLRNIGLVVVALTVGCATEELDTSEASQQIGKGVGTCPDPFDCTLNNGGGVYTEELGTIGFGTDHYMIGRFVNLGAGLQVQGRGYDPNTGNYYGHTAELVRAIYNGQGYSVVGISESLTLPTVTLSGLPPLVGPQIAGLQLVFKVDDGIWTLTFTESLADDPGYNSAKLNPLKEFHAVWNEGEGYQSSLAQEYCTRAPVDATTPGEMDPVVFQQGIDVNPVTAVMVQNNDYVTLSCRHGALATVRFWGYGYRNQATADLFEGAMHMKRASYCGDDTFYTRRDTLIRVRDSLGLMDDTLDPIEFEATWGRPSASSPIRALCVNKHWRRRPGVLFPPDQSGVKFNGQCLSPVTGQVLFTIPECTNDVTAYPLAFGMLADEAVDPPLAP